MVKTQKLTKFLTHPKIVGFLSVAIVAVIIASGIFPLLTVNNNIANPTFSQPAMNNTEENNNTNPILNVTRPNDPGTSQIPIFESEKLNKSMIVQLVFVSQNEISQVYFNSANVVYEPARTNIGNPPLVLVQLFDESNNILQEFNEWHPLWRFSYDGRSGDESLEILPVGDGRFVFPFDPRIAWMKITDLTVLPEVSGNEFTFDLRPSIYNFCQEHPTDADCRISDLAITGVSNYPYGNVTLRLNETRTTTATTIATNNGRDDPTDGIIQTLVTVNSTSGLVISPAMELTTVEPAMVSGIERQIDFLYTLDCLVPGTYRVTFLSQITPRIGPVVDPDSSNNMRQSDVIVTCLK